MSPVVRYFLGVLTTESTGRPSICKALRRVVAVCANKDSWAERLAVLAAFCVL
jgi:hypothetical protein